MQITQYSKDSVLAVSNANFLNESDITFLNEQSSVIQENFEKKQIWRTETEIEVSVLNNIKFPTSASKYWQSVKESSIFFENLVALSFDYKRELVNIKKIERELKIEQDILEVEELEIDLEEALFNKKNYELAAKDRVRELRIWNKKIEELDDGTFDSKNVNTHQEVSLAQRYIREFMSSQGANASPSEMVNLQGVVETSLDNLKRKGKLGELLKIMTKQEILAFPGVENKILH